MPQQPASPDAQEARAGEPETFLSRCARQERAASALKLSQKMGCPVAR